MANLTSTVTKWIASHTKLSSYRFMINNRPSACFPAASSNRYLLCNPQIFFFWRQFLVSSAMRPSVSKKLSYLELFKSRIWEEVYQEAANLHVCFSPPPWQRQQQQQVHLWMMWRHRDGRDVVWRPEWGQNQLKGLWKTRFASRKADRERKKNNDNKNYTYVENKVIVYVDNSPIWRWFQKGDSI